MKRDVRVFFINRYFYPDISATSQMLSDVAFGLAAKGRSVTVITSRQTYEDPGARLPAADKVNGVTIVRIATTRLGRSSLPGRALDYLSFYVSAFAATLRLAKPGDIVVSKTDPPLLGTVTGWAAKLKRAKSVNWLQDIYPEVAQRLGIRWLGSPLAAPIRALRNRSVRRADCNVVIGERMAKIVKSFGAEPSQVWLIQNFCDDVAIQPLARQHNPLRREWGFTEDDFVIGYSGNLGRAHDLETLLGAADLLAGERHVHFLFIGGGHLRDKLAAEAKARDLSNITTRPYQPRERLGLSLTVPDLHWASLIPGLEGLILPSKLYGIAAAGRPLLMVGDSEGDIARLVARHAFGMSVDPRDADAFAGHILALKGNPKSCETLGANARAFIDQHASRAKALDAWSALVETLAANL